MSMTHRRQGIHGAAVGFDTLAPPRSSRDGVSWQIVPRVLIEMLKDPDVAKAQKAMAAMLQMKKIDIETLQRAYAG